MGFVTLDSFTLIWYIDCMDADKKLTYKLGERKYPRVAGVYVILGPNGVYVGQSQDCWARNTLHLAVALGLDCGIIREIDTDWKRVKAEREVAKIFAARGFTIVSQPAGPRKL